jgi:hypothetical protein
MNASVAIQDQLKTIEVSVLISCITSILPILFLYLNTVTVTAGTFEP